MKLGDIKVRQKNLDFFFLYHLLANKNSAEQLCVMATVGGSGDTSFNWGPVFSLPPTGVLSRSVTLLCQRRLFTFYSM